MRKVRTDHIEAITKLASSALAAAKDKTGDRRFWLIPLKGHDWRKFPAVIVTDELDGSQRWGCGEFKTVERMYWHRTGLHAKDPRPAKVRIYEHGELVLFDSCQWMPREVADAMV